ncbi:hypothetical protein E4T45_14413 [Aureobasidium sp. EXF-8846]|nr:hypothetical protein E4T45_14413 [Aureobasidium sp. EXF-8846]
MQLINTSVYDKKTQQRQSEIEATLQEKQRLRDVKERARVMHAFQPQHAASTTYGAAPTAGPAAVRDIQINNLRFRVAADGSKLIRMFGEYTRVDTLVHHLTCIDDSNTDPGATPKITKVAGVTFHRSKHGNLYRAGLVKKSMRYWTKESRDFGWTNVDVLGDNRENDVKKSSELCPRFTATGTEYSNRHTNRSLRDGSERERSSQHSVCAPTAIAAATRTTQTRSLSAKTSFDLVDALRVTVATFPMKLPLIVSLLALTSFAVIAPTQTVAMPTLLSTLQHLLVGHLEALATAKKEPNALSGTYMP